MNNTIIKFLGRGIILPELLEELSDFEFRRQYKYRFSRFHFLDNLENEINSELRRINSEFTIALSEQGMSHSCYWYEWHEWWVRIRLYRGGNFIEKLGESFSDFDQEAQDFVISWEEEVIDD